MQDRKDLRTGVDGQPQPQDVGAAAQPRPQLIQLEIGKLEVTEKVFVQGLSVLPRAGQPSDDGRLPVAEDPLGGRGVQPFGKCREHHGDFVSGGFQTIQRRVASSTERRAAGLAAKRLDPLGRAMLAIPDERMGMCIGNCEVRALLVGTSKAVRVDAFGSSSPTFDLAPGAYWRKGRSHA